MSGETDGTLIKASHRLAVTPVSIISTSKPSGTALCPAELGRPVKPAGRSGDKVRLPGSGASFHEVLVDRGQS